MNEIIVEFARLWGQTEAYCSTPDEEKISEELKKYDSQECMEVLTKWAEEFENSTEEDTYLFFTCKVNELIGA